MTFQGTGRPGSGRLSPGHEMSRHRQHTQAQAAAELAEQLLGREHWEVSSLWDVLEKLKNVRLEGCLEARRQMELRVKGNALQQILLGSSEVEQECSWAEGNIEVLTEDLEVKLSWRDSHRNEHHQTVLLEHQPALRFALYMLRYRFTPEQLNMISHMKSRGPSRSRSPRLSKAQPPVQIADTQVLDVKALSEAERDEFQTEKTEVLNTKNVRTLSGLRCDMDLVFAMALLSLNSNSLETLQVRHLKQVHLVTVLRLPKLRELDVWHVDEDEVPDPPAPPSLPKPPCLQTLTVGDVPAALLTELLRAARGSLELLRICGATRAQLQQVLAMPKLHSLDVKAGEKELEEQCEEKVEVVAKGEASKGKAAPKSMLSWLQVQGLSRGSLRALLVGCNASLKELRLKVGTPPAPGQPDTWPYSSTDLPSLLKEAGLTSLGKLSLERSDKQGYTHVREHCMAQLRLLRKALPKVHVLCNSCRPRRE